MSLFEDSRFVYQDTLFVFFKEGDRPSGEAIKSFFESLGNKYLAENLRESDSKFESITVYSPRDFSAMDIVYTDGEEVSDQIKEIFSDFRTVTLTGEDRSKLGSLGSANARFDVFHFAEAAQAVDDDDSFLDPGGLMLVLERLAELTGGVGYDPQSQTLL